MAEPVKFHTCCYCHSNIYVVVANTNRRGQYCHYDCREIARKEYIERVKNRPSALADNPHEA